MDTNYVNAKILRELPYEYRIPSNDIDGLDLMGDAIKGLWKFGEGKVDLWEEGNTETE